MPPGISNSCSISKVDSISSVTPTVILAVSSLLGGSKSKSSSISSSGLSESESSYSGGV